MRLPNVLFVKRQSIMLLCQLNNGLKTGAKIRVNGNKKKLSSVLNIRIPVRELVIYKNHPQSSRTKMTPLFIISYIV